MRPPCERDCKDRSPTCHTSSERYKEYEELMRQARECRRQESEAMGAYCDGAKRRSNYGPQR